ncbi:hypothetical protein ACRAKI_33810 [Saccharothrix isguenensis]
MTSVPPPPRRRPVPTTPSTRPRVAGLRKRPGTTPAEAAGPESTGPDTASPEAGTGITQVEDASAAEPTPAEPTTAEPAPAANSAAEPGPVEPGAEGGLIEPGLGDRGPDEVEEDLVAPAPGPRPTGRRKRTGEAVAASVLTDDPRPKQSQPEHPQPEHPQPEHPRLKRLKPGAKLSTGGAWAADRRAARARDTGADRNGLVLPIALVALAGLLVALGLWFQSQAGDVRYNQALVDSAGTTEVAGQTREAVEKAFSYNYADVTATEKAANELLVGKAQCQYNAIFEPVRKLAPEQKLVVTVKAVSTGVTSLDDDRATVLLFVDQVALRTTDNQSSGGIAMMRVGARKVEGRWKVDNMEMFGQSGDQAVETAKC